MKRSNLVLTLAVLGLGIFTAQAARAGFVVTLVSPDDAGGAAANTVTVTDGGALDAAAATPGEIEYTGSVGTSFPITLQLSLTNSPGNPSGASLQVTDIVATNSGAVAKHLLIDVTSTDFTSPSGTGLTLVSLFSGNAPAVGGSATFQSAADPANNPYGNDIFPTAITPPSLFSAVAVHTALQVQPNGGSFSTPTQTNTFTASDYSLTNFTTLLIPAGGSYNVSGTTSVNPVTGGTPEPASLALLGLGGVALLRRRR